MDQVNSITLSEQDQKYIKGWSWGGFLVPWIFLFVNKKIRLALGILALFILIQFASFVPILGLTIPGISLSMLSTLKSLNLIYFGIAIWVGIKGREMVWDSKVYATTESFIGKQKLVTKINWLFLVIFWVSSLWIYFNSMSQYMQNPQVFNDKIMMQALNDAQSKVSNINENDFKNGYALGLAEGNKTDPIVSSSFNNQNDSYKNGYKYGFAISCMASGDEITCTKKLLSSGALQ